MSKPRMTYFEAEDALHMVIAEGPEVASVEISPNITAELGADGELIGIENLSASAYVRDSILQ